MQRATVSAKEADASATVPVRSSRLWSGLLQRKCTCGGTPGATGECAECKRKRLSLQPKLVVNQPGDQYEQEADRVAEAVVGGAASKRPSISSLGGGAVQREEPAKPKTEEEKYKEAAKKVGEAFLETPPGKEITKKAEELGDAFISTLPGKIITGTAVAGAIATLAATHKELPIGIPEIPLDKIKPGLKMKITYEGPVDKPSKVMATFSIPLGGRGRSDERKPKQTESEKFRAETARMAADQAKFREGLKTNEEKASEQRMMDAYLRSKMLRPDQLTPRTSPLSFGVAGEQLGFHPGVPVPATRASSPWSPDLKLTGETQAEDPKKKEEETLQRKAAGDHEISSAPPIVDEVLDSPGEPLDSATREFLETRFGYDFGSVRVHRDARAAESARALGAQAYTVGGNVVFDAGQYAPGTTQGQRLLAHELTHVAQQGHAALLSSVGQPTGAKISAAAAPHALARQQATDGVEDAAETPTPEKSEARRPNLMATLDFNAIVEQLHDAMDRLGTDEEAVYRALQKLKRDPEAITEVKKRYKKYGDLMADILDEFSGTELEYALQLLNAGTAGAAEAIRAAPTSDKDIQAAAERIRDAVEGMGTNEEAIYATLLPFEGDAALLLKLQNVYFKLYDEDLRDRLLNEFDDCDSESKSELGYVRELFESPFEVLLREGAELLAGKRDQPRIGFGLSRRKGGKWFEEEFWKLVETKEEVRLEQWQGTPAKALDSLFRHQERWKVDCAQFVQVLEWYALRHMVGATKFNNQVGARLVLRTRRSSGLTTHQLFSRSNPDDPMTFGPDHEEDPRSVDEILQAAPIGSRVRWTSQLLLDHLPPLEQREEISEGRNVPEYVAFQNENTVKMGRDEFAAHPLGSSVKREEIEDKLVSVTLKYVPGSTERRARRWLYISEIEIFERTGNAAANSTENSGASPESDSTPAGQTIPSDGESIQRKRASQTGSESRPKNVPPLVQEVLSESGQPLDTETHAFMEVRFGHQFDNVRVHSNAKAAESAHAVNALAYTVGQNVVFGSGQFSPATNSGQRLLAHELTHTIQQTNEAKSRGSSPGLLEKEADRAADRVLARIPIGSISKAPPTLARKKSPVGTSGRLRAISNWSYVVYEDEIRLRYYDKGPEGKPDTQIGTIPWVTNNPGNLTISPNITPAPTIPPSALSKSLAVGPGAPIPTSKPFPIPEACKSAKKEDAVSPDSLQALPINLGAVGLYACRYAIFPSLEAGMDAIVPHLKGIAEKGGNPNMTVEQALRNFKGLEKGEKAEMERQRKAGLPVVDVRDSYVAAIKAHMTKMMTINEALEIGETPEGLSASELKEIMKEIQGRIKALMGKKILDVTDPDTDMRHIVRGLVQKEGYAAPPGVIFKCSGFETGAANLYDGQQKALASALTSSAAARAELGLMLECK